MKKIFFLHLFTIFLLAEPSVYSDSDFVDTDSLVKKNTQQILLLKQRINQLQEQIEGLKTIINGQNDEIATLRQKLHSINYEKIINQLSERVAALESKKAQTSIVSTMPKNTMQNSQEKTPLASNKKEIEKIKAKKENQPKTSLAKIPSAKLYKEAVLDFTKAKLSSAKSKFLELEKRGYKKAAVKFYLGEIAYKQKKYKKAISYYQESVTINEDAAYMDKLLLHTAFALKRLGRVDEANNFFEAVVEEYGNSASAKIAKKYLK